MIRLPQQGNVGVSNPTLARGVGTPNFSIGGSGIRVPTDTTRATEAAFGGAQGAALGAVGKVVSGLGRDLGDVALRMQQADNTARLIEGELRMKDAVSTFQSDLETDPDLMGRPQRFDKMASDLIGELMVGPDGKPLPRSVQNQMRNNATRYLGNAGIQVAESALKTNNARNRQTILSAMDRSVREGDMRSAFDQLETAAIQKYFAPEDVEAIRDGLLQKNDLFTAQRLLVADPKTLAEMLEHRTKDGTVGHFKHLEERQRDGLIGRAKTAQNTARVDTYNRVIADSINGDFLNPQDVEEMVEDGDLTQGQANNYLNLYYSRNPPPIDTAKFLDLQERISSYDFSSDPTLEQRASLMAEATTTMYGEHLSVLRDAMDERLSLGKTVRSQAKTEGISYLKHLRGEDYLGDVDDPDSIKNYAAAVTEFIGWYEQEKTADPKKAIDKINEITNKFVAPEAAGALLNGPAGASAALFPGGPTDYLQLIPPSMRTTPRTYPSSFAGLPIQDRYEGVRASVFGGKDDPVDNGLSAFGGETGKGAKEGVAIPEKILRAVVGGGKSRWAQTKVRVTTPAGVTKVLPVVDLGTAEWVWEKEGGAVLDFTPGAAEALGGKVIRDRRGKLKDLQGLNGLSFEILPP